MDDGRNEPRFIPILPEHMELHKRLVGNAFDILNNVKFNNNKVDSKKTAICTSPVDNNDKKILLESDMDILKHIDIAIKEAQKRQIKVNTIIIDENLAYTNQMLIPGHRDVYSVAPPMIFGLKIVYQKNLTEDLAANFILTEGKVPESEINALRNRNKELEEKIEKMKEILGGIDL